MQATTSTPRNYHRRSGEIEAIQLTADNGLAVAQWATDLSGAEIRGLFKPGSSGTGSIAKPPTQPRVEIQRRTGEGRVSHTYVSIGDWLTWDGTNFQKVDDVTFRRDWDVETALEMTEEQIEAALAGAEKTDTMLTAEGGDDAPLVDPVSGEEVNMTEQKWIAEEGDFLKWCDEQGLDPNDADSSDLFQQEHGS